MKESLATRTLEAYPRIWVRGRARFPWVLHPWRCIIFSLALTHLSRAVFHHISRSPPDRFCEINSFSMAEKKCQSMGKRLQQFLQCFAAVAIEVKCEINAVELIIFLWQFFCNHSYKQLARKAPRTAADGSGNIGAEFIAIFREKSESSIVCFPDQFSRFFTPNALPVALIVTQV